MPSTEQQHLLSRRQAMVGLVGLVGGGAALACEFPQPSAVGPDTSPADETPLLAAQPTATILPQQRERIAADDLDAKRKFVAQFIRALAGGDLEEIAGYFAQDTWRLDPTLQGQVRGYAKNLSGCTAADRDVVIRTEAGQEVVTVLLTSSCGHVGSLIGDDGRFVSAVRFRLDRINNEVRIKPPLEIIPGQLIPSPTPRTGEFLQELLIPIEPVNTVYPLDRDWQYHHLDAIALFPAGHTSSRMWGSYALPKGFQLQAYDGTVRYPGFLIREEEPVFDEDLSLADVFTGKIWLLADVSQTEDFPGVVKDIEHFLNQYDGEGYVRGIQSPPLVTIERDPERPRRFGRRDVVHHGKSQTFWIHHPLFQSSRLFTRPSAGVWIERFTAQFGRQHYLTIHWGSGIGRQSHATEVIEKISENFEFWGYLL